MPHDDEASDDLGETEKAASDSDTEAVRVVLSVDPERFDDVVRAAASVGLDVDEEMREAGVVAGKVKRKNMSALREVAGVEAMERERTIQLPPPDSAVQ
jgi:hypothetical protein